MKPSWDYDADWDGEGPSFWVRLFSPGGKSSATFVALLSLLKTLASLYLGMNAIGLLTKNPPPEGYPVWAFLNSYFVFALGIVYLVAFALIAFRKRIGLQLSIAVVLIEILFSLLILIIAGGQLSLLGLAVDALLLGLAIHYLADAQNDFLT